MNCPKCGTEFNTKFCSNCGYSAENQSNDGGARNVSTASYAPTSKAKPAKKKGGCLKVVLIVFGIFIFLGVVGSVFGGNDKTDKSASTSAPKDAKSKENKAEEKPVEDPSVPKEYVNALKKAKSYSETMYMSKIGIYNQLTSEYGEQFPAEAAQYAVDNVDADWNANALEKAKSYSETMYMSKIGVYNQLISENGEQFTAEEAQYAVDNVNADWNANALEKAKSYQDSMSMSVEAIRDQLISEHGEQFTAEEAEYAIANLN